MARSSSKNGGTTGGSIPKGRPVNNVAYTNGKTGRTNSGAPATYAPVRNFGGRGSK